jgi:signal transduction histidine kinase
MRVQRLDMNDLMAKVIDSMKYQINTSGVKVSVTNLHSCCGDANMINQIFTNLIDNSIKYKSEERSLRITIKSRVSEGYAVYTVRDNGKGIPENKFSSIFDLFNKIDPYSEGLGLGLSIVRKMVNRHGGDIFVSSREGVFTKFSIKLPLSGESIKSGGTDE